MKRVKWILLGGVVFGAVVFFWGRSWWYPMYRSATGRQTVAQVIDQIGEHAEGVMRERFNKAGVVYPPDSLLFVGLKEEKVLELWAQQAGVWHQIHRYPVLAASGVAGPKLREGDKQVPEGIYQIIGLNPNSSYHLSMKLNYPNAFDLKYAAQEGRTEPGTNIFIHGKASSVGCLAVGDEAIEELFNLVHKVGAQQVHVVISPHDPASRPLFPVPEGLPAWTAELYHRIEAELEIIR